MHFHTNLRMKKSQRNYLSVNSRKSPISHLTFRMATSFLLVVGTIVSINSIGLNFAITALHLRGSIFWKHI